MRKIFVLIVLLVAVAAAWPVYVGVQMENVLREPQAFRLGDIQIQHTVIDYERERYGARVTSTLHVWGDDLALELQLEHRIRHHLLGAVAKTRLAAEPVAAARPEALGDALEQARPRAETWLGLGGGLSSRVSSRPLHVVLGDALAGGGENARLELAAGQGGISYSPERLLLSFDTDLLSASNGSERFDLEGLHYGLLVHPGPDGGYGRLPDYDLSLGARTLRVLEGARERVGADSLQLSAWQNSTARHVDSVLRFRTDTVRTDGLTVGGLESHLNALRWHRPTLLRLLDEWQGLDLGQLEPGARQGLLLGMLLDGMQQMIVEDPVLFGELRLNHEPEKRLRLNLDLGLRGDAQRLLARPLEAIALGVDLEVGLELVDDLHTWLRETQAVDQDQMLAFWQWVEKGETEQWLAVANGTLSSRLRLEDGRLSINGRDQTALLLALVFGLAGGMF